MRRYLMLLLVLMCFLGVATAQENRRYALVWHDEFDGEALDKSVWSKIWRGRADWMIHMSSDERLYALDDGDLVLRGMANDFLPKDTAAYARLFGVTLVTQIPAIPNVDFIDLEDNAQISASSRIFLRTASKNGAWFCLKGMEEEDWEALMAFSERCWRGGSAGEGTVENGLPDAVSTAGTRLANFLEKVAVHRLRFQDFLLNDKGHDLP